VHDPGGSIPHLAYGIMWSDQRGDLHRAYRTGSSRYSVHDYGSGTETA
jgi:hypothetical protein